MSDDIDLIIEMFLTESTLTKGSQRVMSNKKMVSDLAMAVRDDAAIDPSNFPQGAAKTFRKAPDEEVAKWFLELLDSIERSGYEGTVYSRDGVNSEWITRRYIAGSHNMEDLRGVMNMNLRDWYLLKNRNLLEPRHADLFKFNSVRDVGAYVNKHYEEHMKDIRDAAKTAALKKTAKTANLVDNDDYKVYTVFNRNAARMVGLGTQWCTANSEYAGNYENYSSKAMLFQLFPKEVEKDEKGRSEKYQFDASGHNSMSTAGFSFKDVLDHNVDPKVVAEKFPYLYTDLVKALKANKEKLETAMKEMDEDPALASSPNTKTKVYSIDDEIKKLGNMKQAGFFTDKVRPAAKPEEQDAEQPEQASQQPQLGNQSPEGQQMEKVDKDVAAMLESLKKYDILKESVAPVLGMKTLGEKKKVGEERKDYFYNKNVPVKDQLEAPPEEVDINESDKKCPDCGEEGQIRGHMGCQYPSDTRGEVDEGVDQDVLAWMKRFASLGNMKGYGR